MIKKPRLPTYTVRSPKKPTVLMIKNISLFLSALFPTSVFAIATQGLTPGFNWSLLKGKWAESTNHQFGCRPDNLHQWFMVSPDKKTITFKNDRKWKIGTGQELEQYSASILRSHENVLVIRYGSDLPDVPDEMREWEMRFIGPGTYRWRATAWREGEYNDVIGVKCSSN